MDPTTIAESLFFTTVRIDTTNIDGTTGSGTGFLFNYNFKGQPLPFVVTNKHVVENSVSGGITFIQGANKKPILGATYRIDCPNFPSMWTGHPGNDVDITITPLIPLMEFIQTQGVDIFFKTVSSENLPTQTQIDEFDALEQVVFVGYPNGIWDSKNFLPILRKGTTATPISIDYDGKKKFLIDASVFGGSSGSPVFIYESGTYGDKRGSAIYLGTKFFFIGVVAAVYYKTDYNEIINLPIPTQNKNFAINSEMIDLGVVFKAETVIETIDLYIQLVFCSA